MTREARALCGVAAVSLLGGCTLIGFTAGAISDASRGPAPLPAFEVHSLKPGAPVDVLLRDGRRYAGSFTTLAPVPAPEYGAAYERARIALGGEVSLPTLGPVELTRARGGKKRDVELLGFGPGCAVLRLKEGKEPACVPSAEIAEIRDGAGRGIGPSAIEKWTSSGRVPFTETFVMMGASLDAGAPPLSKKQAERGVAPRQTLRLPLEEVAGIEWIRPGGAKVKGLLIGAAADAVVIAAVAVAASQDSGGSSSYSGSGESSCPYVYSWDGRRFVLDAEPFPGSFVEVAQRSDWARLDHVRETDGTYRLRVANELREVEHLDEVKLVVVDHPAGTEVVPDVYGRMHVLGETVEPEAARDGRGADVRGLLVNADGRSWLGSPFGRDPADADDLRDGVVLQFPRPASASRGTLALAARSTPWMPALLHELLSLKGRELEAWYREVNADVFGRSLEGLTREAVPVLRVWDGSGWAFVEFLAALPTATSAVQAFPLDLAALPPGPLRVRIDGLPATFELDRAVVAWDPAVESRVREVDPDVAQSGSGADVRGLLASVDARRHTMRTGDSVELRFAAPPAAPGLVRTVLVKATGWYRILVPGTGEPDTARFDALLNDPGALARWSLERMRGSLRPAGEEKLASAEP